MVAMSAARPSTPFNVLFECIHFVPWSKVQTNVSNELFMYTLQSMVRVAQFTVYGTLNMECNVCGVHVQSVTSLLIMYLSMYIPPLPQSNKLIYLNENMAIIGLSKLQEYVRTCYVTSKVI